MTKNSKKFKIYVYGMDSNLICKTITEVYAVYYYKTIFMNKGDCQMKNKTVLSASNICKSFGPTKALQSFNFELEEGEVRGLIGENGSGKSTFSSILSGLLESDTGEIYLEDKPYKVASSREAAAKGIAMIVQEIGTIDQVSVASNLFINREQIFTKLGCINHQKMQIAAKEALEKIGADYIDPQLRTELLNLEERKLIEIARAMYFNPKILIIDETSNALSTKGRQVLYQSIKSVKERVGSVLFITHDLEELITVCDSVTIMRDGKYIETLFKEDMQIKKLRELMVGREIADNFYRTDFDSSYSDEVIFQAKHISSVDLNDISLALHQGEILGIGGLAECGMHELGRVLFGLDKPDSGEVIIRNNTQINNPRKAIANGIGYLSKNRDTEAIIIKFSVKDNICLPTLKKMSKYTFIPPQREKELSSKWSEELSIKMRSDEQLCNQLSGGNKQKVVLAKWMGNDSKILIMDCPTRGIDIGVKENIYKLMMQFKKEGRSVIMISEELPELIGMSDRMIILKDGAAVCEINRSPSVTEHQIIQYMI